MPRSLSDRYMTRIHRHSMAREQRDVGTDAMDVLSDPTTRATVGALKSYDDGGKRKDDAEHNLLYSEGPCARAGRSAHEGQNASWVRQERRYNHHRRRPDAGVQPPSPVLHPDADTKRSLFSDGLTLWEIATAFDGIVHNL